MRTTRVALIWLLILTLIEVPAATAAQKITVVCSAPKNTVATQNFDIICTSNTDLSGANAHLQFDNGSEGWQEVKQGTKSWAASEVIFTRVYSDPKSDYYDIFRVVTDSISGSSKSIISNQFDVRITPYKAPSPKQTQSSNSSSRSTTKTVRIPNFLGTPVQWLRTHPNAYPGVRFMITGSSCAISDLMSGAAIVVFQNPSPMQIRPYNAAVTLKTNC